MLRPHRNSVVNSELERHGIEGFRFFSFTPFGVPILVLGVAYMIFARRWLTTGADMKESGRPSLADWIDEYQPRTANTACGCRIIRHSLVDPWRNCTFAAPLAPISWLSNGFANWLVKCCVRRRAPNSWLAIFFSSTSPPNGDIPAMRQKFALEEMPLSGDYFIDRSQEIGMAEVILPPTSDLIGQTIVAAQFRTRFGLTVVGMRHGIAACKGNLLNKVLKVGDTLLLIGPWKDIERLQSDGYNLAIIKLPAELKEVLPAPGKTAQALVCLALVVGLMVSGVIPNVQAALIGCLLMGAPGCVNLTSAYRSIDWKTIVLIVGMLPFSIALQRTGGVDLAADALRSLTSGAGDRVVLATLFTITTLLGMFISNTATAVLMAPVALAVAHEMRLSPYPFAMIVASAASTAFMTPVRHRSTRWSLRRVITPSATSCVSACPFPSSY